MNLNEALEKARGYLEQTFATSKIFDVALEEVELKEAERWLITFSFVGPNSDLSHFPSFRNPFMAGGRHFKVVTITNTGELESIKNKNIEYA